MFYISPLCSYRKVAGDKCVRGTESYFFELVRDCPALPPQGLYLRVQGQPTYLPGRTITFQLTQFAVRTRTVTVHHYHLL